jgi:hypothetical protein
MSKTDFSSTFDELKKILTKYEKFLKVTANSASAYNLNAGYSEKYKQEIFFGGVQIKKNYVSFYIMPVYINPELLKDISPELKKRMQGKSCFNFNKTDEQVIKELGSLADKGFQYYKKNNML